jgi:ATP phosphoribosyltransferase regulatory subunit
MSKPKVFEKPVGVQDYVPEAVSKLRRIEYEVLQCMERWGYSQIITPTLEYYDTVGVASATEDKRLFKLLDRKGNTLVLRSDMTAPIARVVSSLLEEESFPIRLSYHSNVFRAIEADSGRDAEFFQTGVELVGDESSESDAEVIALAIACLQAAGVTSFKLAVGHVGFLNGLFGEMLKDREDAQTALKECLLHHDYVGYREKLDQLGLSADVRSELESILRLRGGQEICSQAKRLTPDPVAQQAIAHLCEMWSVLEAYGVSEHVLIDLTMIGDFGYYTGMTFEGYAADLGFPVCSGGRYDNLLAQFGRPAPATGFALKTNRILEVTAKQPVEGSYRVLVVYNEEGRKDAFQAARDMRAQTGKCVETRLVAGGKSEFSMETLEQDAYRVRGKLYRNVSEFWG